MGLIPGLGRSPGEGNCYPLQYSCLENAVDRRNWWATVHKTDHTRWGWWCWRKHLYFLHPQTACFIEIICFPLTMLVGIIHVVMLLRGHLFTLLYRNLICDIPQLIYSTLHKYLDYFKFYAVMNNTTLDLFKGVL